MDFDWQRIFLCISDAELPTARGLKKSKMTKSGLLEVINAIFAIVQGTGDSTSFWLNWKSKTEIWPGHFQLSAKPDPAHVRFWLRKESHCRR